jgi:hypothetical protein
MLTLAQGAWVQQQAITICMVSQVVWYQYYSKISIEYNYERGL